MANCWKKDLPQTKNRHCQLTKKQLKKLLKIVSHTKLNNLEICMSMSTSWLFVSIIFIFWFPNGIVGRNGKKFRISLKLISSKFNIGYSAVQYELTGLIRLWQDLWDDIFTLPGHIDCKAGVSWTRNIAVLAPRSSGGGAH